MKFLFPKISIFVFGLIAFFSFGKTLFAMSSFISKDVNYNMTPYEQSPENPKQSFLFLGDSTGVGTGAKSNTQSVAGYFGQDFPNALIRNNSENGRKIKGLFSIIDETLNQNYDIVFFQIGANDILRVTPIEQCQRDIEALIEKVQPFSKYQILIHSGNVGVAPAFFPPISWYYTHRTKVFRDMYLKVADQYPSVIYIDLFREKENDPFSDNIDHYYAPDYLHPAGPGYRWWYDQIRKQMKNVGIDLEKS